MIALAPGECHVHVVRPDAVDDRVVERMLAGHEWDRSKKFLYEADGDRWRRYRAAMRDLLGKSTGTAGNALVIREGVHGKPELEAEGVHFNLSHTTRLGLLAVTKSGPVGIDLEHHDRRAALEDCRPMLCHPDDVVSDLLALWTAKEACVKAMGTGFAVDPASLHATGDSVIAPDGSRWRLARLRDRVLEDYSAHLCSLQELRIIRIFG